MAISFVASKIGGPSRCGEWRGGATYAFPEVSIGERVMNRREFLRLAGLSAVSDVSILSGCAPSVEPTTTPSTVPGDGGRPSLGLGPVKVEPSPNEVIQTVGYNGSAAGPLLRVKERQQVTVNIRNDADVPELGHWHGFYVPSEVD